MMTMTTLISSSGFLSLWVPPPWLLLLCLLFSTKSRSAGLEGMEEEEEGELEVL